MVCFRDKYSEFSNKTKSIIQPQMKRLKSVGPINAGGFYDIDKKLLLSIAATLLSYVIILLQAQI